MASIPVLDLREYSKGTPEQRKSFTTRMGKALEEFGFFTIEHHGIDADVIGRGYDRVQAFFALPEEVKATYAIPGIGGARGYIGMGKEHAKNRKVGDLKEFWHVGRELPEGHAYTKDYAPNVWPDEHVPGFRDALLKLYDSLDGAAATLLRALAGYFDYPENTFADMAKDGNSVLRTIHYPPLPDDVPEGAVRAAQHEDINLMTLLCEGTSPGLELLTREGKWLPIDTLRGQIVVDSGDMMQRCTNGVIPSTTHRVVNPAGPNVARYSMPFFVHPYNDCSLDALPGTVTDERPKKYPPITAGDFLTQRLREIGLLK